MIRVLFVCLGNICRSPMAEAVFQQKVNAAGLGSQIRIDSAGTSSYHEGETAHRGTLKVLQKNGIPYAGRSRPLEYDDFYSFDYLLAMDNQNLHDMQRRKPDDSNAELGLFLEYGDGMSEIEVPDPYYNDRFDDVYAMIDTAADGLLNYLIREHELK